MPVVVSAVADELCVALVDSVYRTEDPAAVGRVVCEVVASVDVSGVVVDESVETTSTVLEEAALVSP
jgi:hypothetical protein